MNDSAVTHPLVPAPPPLSLVQRFAQRFEVEPDKLLTTLKATCFRTERSITNEQMMSLLIVAEQYHLNPFTKELFAFDDKRGGIIPYVSVDGWARIINEHPQYDGAEFAWNNHAQDPSMTCTIWRKDRAHPTVVTEYMNECKRGTDPWSKTPRRMLRHKSLMQCARLAFGFAGIYDQDEAERIRDGGMVERVDTVSSQRAALRQVIDAPQVQQEEVPVAGLQDLVSELNDCTDADEAALVLDRGRTLLGEDDYATLVGEYTRLYEPENS